MKSGLAMSPAPVILLGLSIFDFGVARVSELTYRLLLCYNQYCFYLHLKRVYIVNLRHISPELTDIAIYNNIYDASTRFWDIQPRGHPPTPEIVSWAISAGRISGQVHPSCRVVLRLIECILEPPLHPADMKSIREQSSFLQVLSK